MNTALIEEKKDLPNEFDRIAEHYDTIVAAEPNYDKHMRWSAERLAASPTGRILDLCCGTGRSTHALIDVYPKARIIGLDASRGMLDVARRKPDLRGAEFVVGDATAPQDAGVTSPLHGVFMAYGLRNLPDPDRCLASVFQLLESGGRICLHDYSVRGSLSSALKWHLHWARVLLPGSIRTGTVKAHYYLWRSVNEFEGPPALVRRLERAGFVNVRVEEMDGDVRGVLHSFVATRP